VEQKVADALTLSGSLVKFHCRTFWTTKRDQAPPQDWSQQDRLELNVEGTWLTRPGIFSWNKVDEGSRLLLDSLPDDIRGEVADLGAGWGYLSLSVAARYPDITRLDLYEAELLALEAAQANFARSGIAANVGFHWQDVTAGLGPHRHYDVIVMNPPFHSDKATDVALGQAFITSAARALRPGGRLMMVANRQLPYEAILQQSFAQVTSQRETPLFKILFARR
jgi:16S rRNA (guanine1207-N2)-methyltransferase